MSDQTLHGIEDAIRAHFEDQAKGGSREGKGDVIVDWVVGITVSNIIPVERGEIVGYANLAYYPEGNPNAHIALAAWVADDINQIMHPETEED